MFRKEWRVMQDGREKRLHPHPNARMRVRRLHISIHRTLSIAGAMMASFSTGIELSRFPKNHKRNVRCLSCSGSQKRQNFDRTIVYAHLAHFSYSK